MEGQLYFLSLEAFHFQWQYHLCVTGLPWATPTIWLNKQFGSHVQQGLSCLICFPTDFLRAKHHYNSFSPWEYNIPILMSIDWHLILQARFSSLANVLVCYWKTKIVLRAWEKTGTAHWKPDLDHNSLTATLNYQGRSPAFVYEVPLSVRMQVLLAETWLVTHKR